MAYFSFLIFDFNKFTKYLNSFVRYVKTSNIITLVLAVIRVLNNMFKYRLLVEIRLLIKRDTETTTM